MVIMTMQPVDLNTDGMITQHYTQYNNRARASQTCHTKNMADEQTATTSSYWDELTSPLNLCLIAVIVYLLYKIIRSNFESEAELPPPPPQLPKIRKDLTVAELKKYDGTQPDGRVLLAVNGVIFDVTKGKRFYGPGKWLSYFVV